MGQLLTEFAHIMTTYDFIWAKQDFEQCLNRLQLDHIFIFGQLFTLIGTYIIMTIYYFLSAKEAILSNVRTDFNLTQFLLLVNV